MSIPEAQKSLQTKVLGHLRKTLEHVERHEELIAKNMHHVFSIRIRIAQQCSNFTVMVSRETLFSCKYWHSITPKHFLWESLFPWGNYYFLNNKDWMSGFSLVYYEWGRFCFGGVNIHRYIGLCIMDLLITGKKAK